MNIPYRGTDKLLAYWMWEVEKILSYNNIGGLLSQSFKALTKDPPPMLETLDMFNEKGSQWWVNSA